MSCITFDEVSKVAGAPPQGQMPRRRGDFIFVRRDESLVTSGQARADRNRTRRFSCRDAESVMSDAAYFWHAVSAFERREQPPRGNPCSY